MDTTFSNVANKNAPRWFVVASQFAPDYDSTFPFYFYYFFFFPVGSHLDRNLGLKPLNPTDPINRIDRVTLPLCVAGLCFFVGFHGRGRYVSLLTASHCVRTHQMPMPCIRTCAHSFRFEDHDKHKMDVHALLPCSVKNFCQYLKTCFHHGVQAALRFFLCTTW